MAIDTLSDGRSSTPRKMVVLVRLPLQLPLVIWAMKVRAT
jgi:hypothetical protein